MSNAANVKTIEPVGPGGMELLVNRCLNPEECDMKQFHLRVGNEIHHCHGGDGCECYVCINTYWNGKQWYERNYLKEGASA